MFRSFLFDVLLWVLQDSNPGDRNNPLLLWLHETIEFGIKLMGLLLAVLIAAHAVGWLPSVWSVVSCVCERMPAAAIKVSAFCTWLVAEAADVLSKTQMWIERFVRCSIAPTVREMMRHSRHTPAHMFGGVLLASLALWMSFYFMIPRDAPTARDIDTHTHTPTHSQCSVDEMVVSKNNLFERLPADSRRYNGMVIPVRFNGYKVPVLALVDSGADVTLIAKSVMDALPAALFVENGGTVQMSATSAGRGSNIVSAANTPISIVGYVSGLRMYAGSLREPIELTDVAVIATVVPDIILGRDVLGRMHSNIVLVPDALNHSVHMCEESGTHCVTYKQRELQRQLAKQQIEAAAQAHSVTGGDMFEERRRGWVHSVWHAMRGVVVVAAIAGCALVLFNVSNKRYVRDAHPLFEGGSVQQ